MKRIHHPWDKWECYPAGFHNNTADRLTDAQALKAYADFLRDIPRFEAALTRVLAEWPNSCEHNLSNESMNRIAWLGQAAMCIDTGVPNCYRAGFFKLTADEQLAANRTAFAALNRWLESRGEPAHPEITSAASRTKVNKF